MVNFMPLDVTDDDSVGMILSHIDNTMQYGEDEVSFISSFVLAVSKQRREDQR